MLTALSAGLAVLVASGIFVAVAIFLLGIILSETMAFLPLTEALGEIAWSASAEFTLVAVPLFVLMGEILLRSGVTDNLYVALNRWLGRIPGGLMHSNVAAAALFSATSGSSVATAATIGTVAIPNMDRYGYNKPLFLGSLAAGGTLGILIPPSINMVIYGMIAEQSIGSLYLAATIPGLLLAIIFSFTILLLCLLKPAWSGGGRSGFDWRSSLLGLRHLLPIILLFLVVVGSIYAGIATPTEAAALGVLASLAVGWRGLSFTVLIEACEATMRTTCMVMLIVVAASFLTFCMASTGVTRAITDIVVGFGLSPLVTMLYIVAFYLVLGCFMEPISMMLATAPVVVPIVIAIGYDPVWFGVVMMILSEAGLITPPIGVNLFVVQAVRGSGPFRDVVIGSLPFLFGMLVLIGLLIAAPDLALWLPRQVAG
jgi:tripartite ATP-independent transporter DctM subunit